MLDRMSEGVVTWVKNTAVDRTIDAHVKLISPQEVQDKFRQLVSKGGVPLVYANHQGHADGIPLAVVSQHLRNLVSNGQDRPLRGLAIILAKSMANGAQSSDLKMSYDLLIEGGKRKGAEPITVTRDKDEQLYGMRRSLLEELRPLRGKLIEGFGVALLPEGTVQAGRHPEGASKEDIYGMQRLTNRSLLDFYEYMKKILRRQGKWPFFQPLGLHGSFRIMQSADGGGAPTLTPIGRRSLMQTGPLGIALVRIDANLLAPFDEGEVIADLGAGWASDTDKFNTYAMRKVARGIPLTARGEYAFNPVTPAIEFRRPS